MPLDKSTTRPYDHVRDAGAVPVDSALSKLGDLKSTTQAARMTLFAPELGCKSLISRSPLIGLQSIVGRVPQGT